MGSNISSKKEADIVSKVEDGYIIKRWKYYLYLKDCLTYELMCARSKESPNNKEAPKKKERRDRCKLAPRTKASKTRDFRQPSQALKEGKTLEMLTAKKNHTGGGYRADGGYVFSPGMLFQMGTALLPMGHFYYIPRVLSAGELAAALSVLGGQAGHQAGTHA